MRDTTATYQQLQQTIVRPGCPICGLSVAAVKSYLDTLLWESSTDPNAYAMLGASLGFCGRHSRQLLDFGGQRPAAAVVERAALLATIRRLPDLVASIPAPSKARLAWPWRAADIPGDQEAPAQGIEPCPACVRAGHEEERATRVFLAHLDEFAGPLEAAGGLCLPHFIQVTRAAKAPARAVLLAIQQRIWAELAANLEEFIDKQKAHHFGESISEPGRIAVERTIAALTGEYPAR
jgi:hypothetical protein